MDAPVWTNDLVYLDQMVITMVITVALIVFCFYISKRADRRRNLRMAQTPAALDAHTTAASEQDETSEAHSNQ